ncbi:hypothetical protein SLEP1_g34274 [Rubroshorea leprosula]|uniref:C2H2-type domain-containing protein n=1 Tax=Rubroshorea leprosula TaxID=152421 RepID=A0AAV5KJJ8_9ROSI|nr:hypothetical protein SLEP1_g34274 [Rubroshorea leprosula]
MHKRTWSKLIPTKISAFGWQVMQNRIPTKLNLYQRGIVHDNNLMCGLCGDDIEDKNHLFIHCRVAHSVRSKCAKWWRFLTAHPKTCQEDFEQHRLPIKDSSVQAGWDVVWFSTLWSLWLARNRKIFKNQVCEEERIFELVQLRAFSWIKSRTTGYSFNFYEWMLEPLLSLKAKRSLQ